VAIRWRWRDPRAARPAAWRREPAAAADEPTRGGGAPSNDDLRSERIALAGMDDSRWRMDQSAGRQRGARRGQPRVSVARRRQSLTAIIRWVKPHLRRTDEEVRRLPVGSRTRWCGVRTERTSGVDLKKCPCSRATTCCCAVTV
jgi:hypothetical protein